MADTTYATVFYLIIRMGQNVSATNPGGYDQATDRTPPFTTADNTIGQYALNYAAGRIDAKLAARGYVVPVDIATYTGPVDFLKGLCLDIAVGHLWITHPLHNPPDDAQAAYDTALETLAELADGTCVLPTDEALPTSSALGAKPVAGGYARVFTESATAGLF